MSTLQTPRRIRLRRRLAGLLIHLLSRTNPSTAMTSCTFRLSRVLWGRACRASEVVQLSVSDLARIGLRYAVDQIERTGRIEVSSDGPDVPAAPAPDTPPPDETISASPGTSHHEAEAHSRAL